MNILVRVPRSVLIMLDSTKEARQNIFKLASFAGINPSRIYFIPMVFKNYFMFYMLSEMFLLKVAWKNHLYRISACDLVLDTFIYGAHTTASGELILYCKYASLYPSRVRF